MSQAPTFCLFFSITEHLLGMLGIKVQPRVPRIPDDALPEQRSREKAAGQDIMLSFSPGKSKEGADVSAFETQGRNWIKH